MDETKNYPEASPLQHGGKQVLTFDLMLEQLTKEALSLKEITQMTKGRLESLNTFPNEQNLEEGFVPEDPSNLMERLRSLQRLLRDVNKKANRNYEFLIQNLG